MEQDKDMKIEEAEEMNAVPPGPNQDRPVCVCLPIHEHVPVLLYACFRAPVFFVSGAVLCVYVSRVRADSALARSAAHHTANC